MINEATVTLYNVGGLLNFLGAKKPPTDRGQAAKLRKILSLKGWKLKCSWDCFGEQLQSCHMQKKVSPKDIPFLEAIAPFAGADHIPITQSGMRRWYAIEDNKLVPSEDPWGSPGKAPRLTTGAKGTIVDALLKQPQENLILFLGIHPYLDAAIEQKLHRKTRAK